MRHQEKHKIKRTQHHYNHIKNVLLSPQVLLEPKSSHLKKHFQQKSKVKQYVSVLNDILLDHIHWIAIHCECHCVHQDAQIDEKVEGFCAHEFVHTSVEFIARGSPFKLLFPHELVSLS